MMRIGELGKKADCLVQTVRFYESEGLLPEPARSEGNFINQHGPKNSLLGINIKWKLACHIISSP